MELQQTPVNRNSFFFDDAFVPTLLEQSDKTTEQEKNLKKLQAKETFSRYLETCSDCV